jgi:hypothetical protein
VCYEFNVLGADVYKDFNLEKFLIDFNSIGLVFKNESEKIENFYGRVCVSDINQLTLYYDTIDLTIKFTEKRRIHKLTRAYSFYKTKGDEIRYTKRNYKNVLGKKYFSNKYLNQILKCLKKNKTTISTSNLTIMFVEKHIVKSNHSAVNLQWIELKNIKRLRGLF